MLHGGHRVIPLDVLDRGAGSVLHEHPDFPRHVFWQSTAPPPLVEGVHVSIDWMSSGYPDADEDLAAQFHHILEFHGIEAFYDEAQHRLTPAQYTSLNVRYF